MTTADFSEFSGASWGTALVNVDVCFQLDVDGGPALLAVARLRHDITRLRHDADHVVVDARAAIVVVVVGHRGARVQRRPAKPLRLVVLAAPQHQVGERAVGGGRGGVALPENAHSHRQRRRHRLDRFVETASLDYRVAEVCQRRRRPRVIAVAVNRCVGGSPGGGSRALEQRQPVPYRPSTTQAVDCQRMSLKLVANKAVRQIVAISPRNQSHHITFHHSISKTIFP